MGNITFTEGSGLQDSIFGKSQAPIKLFLEKRAEAFEAESALPHLFAMERSTHWGEKLTSMTAMDGFVAVGENGEYPSDGMQEGYSKFLENMTWKDSFSISREMVDDTKLMDMKKKPAAFVTGYYRTREMYGAAIYGGAIAGEKKVDFRTKRFDVTCADGKPLFDAGHPSKVKGAAQSNKFADAFSVDALSAMECAMQNAKGDNGEILAVAPDTILIPNIYTLKRDVFAAIGADKDPATANNGFNFQFGRWNVIVWAYLNQHITAGSAPWIMLDSTYNKENSGAVWFDRTDLDVRSIIDDGNDANKWLGYSRFVAGFNDWRFAAVGGISGGTQLIG